MCLKVKSKVQLANLLDVVFPEFSSCFNQDSNQFLFMLDLLEVFYHPSLITKLTEQSFIFRVEKIAQKRGLRTSARIASTLFSLAQNTLAAKEKLLSFFN